MNISDNMETLAVFDQNYTNRKMIFQLSKYYFPEDVALYTYLSPQ